ncbi:hypothetical protein [Bacillus wiedmannii]|uniref:hypothetical protein n=1 Tax=Bacillus wiedmannii TaxID=1890302 RepID=UPI003D196CAE
MTRETSMPAQKIELFTYDEKKNVYKPLTEGGAIPVVVKGGSVGGGGTASTGEVTIKNDKLVVQLVDKSLETKVTNDSLNVNVLNPVRTVESKVTNASLDVKVLNPTETVNANITNKTMDVNVLNPTKTLDANITNKSVDVKVLNPTTETTIKNKSLDVKVAKSERKIIDLFGGKVDLKPSEPNTLQNALKTNFIDVGDYEKLALTMMFDIKENQAGDREISLLEIRTGITRTEVYMLLSHDGINTHGIVCSMAMSPDEAVISANGKFIDISAKYVKFVVVSQHGESMTIKAEAKLVLK